MDLDTLMNQLKADLEAMPVNERNLAWVKMNPDIIALLESRPDCFKWQHAYFITSTKVNDTYDIGVISQDVIDYARKAYWIEFKSKQDSAMSKEELAQHLNEYILCMFRIDKFEDRLKEIES